MAEIVLKANLADMKDHELREWFSIMQRQIERINKRTKNHTIKLQELEKRIKELEESLKK